MAAASRHFKVSSGYISAAIKNKLTLLKEWKLFYKEQRRPLSPEDIKVIPVRNKGIEVRDILTGEIFFFNSITKCAEFFGVCNNTINRYLNNKKVFRTKYIISYRTPL